MWKSGTGSGAGTGEDSVTDSESFVAREGASAVTGIACGAGSGAGRAVRKVTTGRTAQVSNAETAMA